LVISSTRHNIGGGRPHDNIVAVRPRRYALSAPPGEVQPIDRYTIGHVAWGVMLGLGSVPWWATLGQAVLWEIIENPLKRALPQVFPDARPDTLANSTCDILACMAGWAVMRALPPGPTPAVWRDSSHLG
jgi:hypothetical protein